MMFGHPSQHGHMMSGVSKAAKSAKTPPHLKKHLEARMKMAGKMPITGSKTQMKPSTITGPDGSVAQGQSQIKASPMPFQNAQGALQSGAGTGPNLGIGNGKSANAAGIKGAKAGKIQVGPTGGYRPKKNFGPSGNPKFYGG